MSMSAQVSLVGQELNRKYILSVILKTSFAINKLMVAVLIVVPPKKCHLNGCRAK